MKIISFPPLHSTYHYLLLALAGICLTLAHAPLHLFPLAFLGGAYVGRALLLNQNSRHAFWQSVTFCTGYFLSGFCWIALALFVHPESYVIGVTIVVLMLGVIIIGFQAMGMFLAWKLPLPPLLKLTAIAAFWMITEWLRVHLSINFPWLLIGYSWSFHPVWMQIASVIGVWGCSFFAMWIFLLPACFFIPATKQEKKYAGIIIIGVLTLSGFFGAWRLASADSSHVENVKLRVVQANIPQSEKWKPEMRLLAIQEHIKLSRSLGSENITHIIWPEMAITFPPQTNPSLVEMLKKMIPPNATLIFGAPYHEGKKEWNSIYVMQENGEISDRYDKHTLVPFGEYVPFPSVLLPLKKLTESKQIITVGRGKKTIEAPTIGTMRGLICYEVIFPDEMLTTPKPALLLNLTNDAWFGKSIGPYQHFSMAQFRAIEQGIPLLRAAGGGISGMIDAYGRVENTLGLDKKGVLDVELPRALSAPTFYSFGGFIMSLLALYAVGMLMLILHR